MAAIHRPIYTKTMEYTRYYYDLICANAEKLRYRLSFVLIPHHFSRHNWTSGSEFERRQCFHIWAIMRTPRGPISAARAVDAPHCWRQTSAMASVTGQNRYFGSPWRRNEKQAGCLPQNL